MQFAILYSSKTGSTRSLAEHIKAALPAEDCTFFGKTADAPGALIDSAGILFVGFWTCKGSCDDETATFLKRIRGKCIALFGTAGFGGSAQYFQRILSHVAPLIDKSCKMLTPFVCMGKIAQDVLARYTRQLHNDPESERVIRLIKNYEEAKAHPDASDFNALLAWTESIIVNNP